MKDKAELALIRRYCKCIRPELVLQEIQKKKGGSPAEIKRQEGRILLSLLPEQAVVVALDRSGRQYNSEVMATELAIWREQARQLYFVIGGAEGLDKTILQRSDHILSLGEMTWPHMLARIMLVEQIYRVQTIQTKHPYHKSRILR